jgi:hypothetical protein
MGSAKRTAHTPPAGRPFANALNLGSVQAVDLGTALAARLIAHPPSEGQQPRQLALEPRIALDLADNVADDAAEIGPQFAQSLVGALELAGVAGLPKFGAGHVSGTCQNFYR